MAAMVPLQGVRACPDLSGGVVALWVCHRATTRPRWVGSHTEDRCLQHDKSGEYAPRQIGAGSDPLKGNLVPKPLVNPIMKSSAGHGRNGSPLGARGISGAGNSALATNAIKSGFSGFNRIGRIWLPGTQLIPLHFVHHPSRQVLPGLE